MPIYTCCSHVGCYTKTQHTVPAAEKPWFCADHETHEQRSCQFMGCNAAGNFTDPSLKGKAYCLHHRRVEMDSRKNSSHRAEIEKLEAKLEIATEALDFYAGVDDFDQILEPYRTAQQALDKMREI